MQQSADGSDHDVRDGDSTTVRHFKMARSREDGWNEAHQTDQIRGQMLGRALAAAP
jgi:hypothetical protein